MVDEVTEDVSLQTPPPPAPIEQSSAPAFDVSTPEDNPSIPAIELTDKNQPPQLTAVGMDQRASVLAYALQEKSPGKPALLDVVQQGKEDGIRMSLAYSQRQKQQNAAMNVIGNLMKSREYEPLTEEETKTVQEIAQQAGQVDEATIVEKIWANNYVKELIHTPAQLVAAGMAAAPVQTMHAANTAAKAIGVQQVMLGIKAKYDKMWEDMPYIFGDEGSKGQDKLTSWIRPMVLAGSDAFLLQNATPGSKEFTEFEALGIKIPTVFGSNLKEQREMVYLMGPEKAKGLVEATAEYLWSVSPTAARTYIDAMASYTQDRAAADNLMGVANIALNMSGVKLARGVNAEEQATRRIMDNSVKFKAAPPEPVKVSEEFAKANKDIIPDLATILEPKGVKTARTSRAMSPYELEKAAGAFPEEGSYPPSRAFYSHSAGSAEAPRGIPQNADGVASQSPRGIVEDATPRGMSPRELDNARAGTPGYSLSPQIDMEEYRNAAIEVKRVQRELDDFRRSVDEGRVADDDASRLKTKELQKELDHATAIRDTTSAYKVHPDIARAQRGVQSYLASGVNSLKTAPTGTGAEVRADLQATLTTLGRAEEAITTGAVRQVAQRAGIAPDDPAAAIINAGKDLPSSHRPNPMEPNDSALSREGVMRGGEELYNQNAELLAQGLGGQRVQRLTEEDLMAKYNQSKVAIAAKYKGDVQNAVLDQELIWNPEQNVYYVKTRLGRTDATGWTNEFSARNELLLEYGIKPEYGVTVTQHGNSFYGFILQPLDESMNIKTMVLPTNNKTPSYFGESLNFMGKIKGAQDTTSLLQMQARHTATHVPQRVNKIIQEVASSVQLTNQENRELARMLKMSELDISKTGEKGKWWDTPTLEREYANIYGRIPSQNIIDGYQTYRQLMDFDYRLRANYLYSFWARQGMENWTIKNGDQISESFFGKVVDSIDYSKVRNKAVLFIDETGQKDLKWSNDIKMDKDGFKTQLDDLIATKGYQIIKLGQPHKRPLKDVDGREFYYVITKTGERSALDPNKMLPYREGPHVMYTHPHFIGQPILSTDSLGQPTYAGDKIFRSGGSSEAEAKAWALKYDTARQLMNAGDDVALTAYLRNNLKEDIDEFKSLFVGENALDRDMPIAYHSHGRNIFDQNPDLMDGTYNGVKYNRQQMQEFINDFSNPEAGLNSGFIQERANQQLMVPKDLGNVGPDRFQLEAAPTLDPFISLNRGLKQANRVHVMEDYKVLAAESFVSEFRKYIQNVTDEALQRNPVHYLYHGQIDSGAPREVQNRMMTVRENVKNFIGMQSDLSQDLGHFEAKMQNTMYKVLGSERTAAVLENNFVQEALIPMIKDPASYARAAAFKLRMGVFNPIQYWQQSQNVATIMMISPKAGFEGAAIASYLQAGGRYALDDAGKMDYYAGMIAKSSQWTRAEAREALQAYKDSGIGLVGSESANKANVFADPKLFQSRWLDKGDMFFTHGEGYSRDTAYFTAYREWKTANPGQTPNQYDLGEILRRTNDLTFNMTRASNSSLQNNSFLSIPLQFQTFRIRQMELMLGAAKGAVKGDGSGRIGGAELARMMGGYATLYGIPTALTAPLGIYSFYDDIRLAAKERGYNLDNPYFKAMHEGILALGIYAATGKNLNVASAWGPGSSTLLNDFNNAFWGSENSKTVGQLLGGPVGGTIQTMAFATQPIMRWAYGHISGEQYPLQAEDFARFADITTTTSNLKKWWEAYNTQMEFTKTGMKVGDANGWDGFIKTVFGLSNREYQDSFLIAKNRKEIVGLQEAAGNEIRALYTKAKKAHLDGESAIGDDYMRKAIVIGKRNGIHNERMMEYFNQTSNDSLHQRMNNKMLDPRAEKRQEYMDEILGRNQ